VRLFALVLLVVTPAAAGEWPGESWSEVDPAALGWSAEALASVGAEAERAGASALLVVSSGQIVFASGDIRRRTDLHSAAKPLIGALVGSAVAEGKIDLSATLGELGVDDDPPLTPAETRARVSDLLTMRSGVYHRANGETPEMWLTRPKRGSHPPGTFWYYNNWDALAVAVIFERAAGDLGDELARRIAEPLEMQDFGAADVGRIEGPFSVYPVRPIRMSARDLARFGLLYLRGGAWRGRQVLPESWVETSTRSHAIGWYESGYGYYWSVGRKGYWPVPDGSYLALGVGGQYLLVAPQLDLVIVATTYTGADAWGLVRWTLFGRALDVPEFFSLVAHIVAARPAGNRLAAP
jgi:CubicO group peptidase (beta-lactamase class C family)